MLRVVMMIKMVWQVNGKTDGKNLEVDSKYGVMHISK